MKKGRASIATTATNTAVGFTLIGLVTTVIFLIGNGIIVFSTLTNIQPPDIKKIVIQGLENGPVKINVDMEFPSTPYGNYISAQTEGPIKVSAFIAERGKDFAQEPSISVEIPKAISINLASKEPTKLIIDDLAIQLDKSFDSGILSKIVAAQMANKFEPELLPNIRIKVDTRVVFKSLWIPLGASINLPIELDLAEIMKKKAKEAGNKPKEEKKEEKAAKPLTDRELKKQQAIENFNFMPRSLKVVGSDKDKFEIDAKIAIPAALIPDFLFVEMPEIKLQADFYELGTVEKVPERFIQIGMKPFLVLSAPDDNLNAEIDFDVRLEIQKTDVKALRKILELVRDNEKYKIGIRVRQSEELIERLKDKESAGLMYWLRDFYADIPVGEMLKKADEAKKLEMEKKLEEAKNTDNAKKLEKTDDAKKLDSGKSENAETDSEEKKPAKSEEQKTEIAQPKSDPSDQKTIVSAKFLRTEKLEKGGKFVFQIQILRSIVEFFEGSLPVLDLKASLKDKSELLAIKIYSDEVNKASNAKTIDINIELGLSNLEKAVYTGLRAGNLGTEEMHEKIPEVREITDLNINFVSENVISQLASVFDLNVLFGEKGLERVKFQDSETIIYPKRVNDKKEIKVVEEKEGKEKEPKKLELSTKLVVNNDENSKKLLIGASVDLIEIPYIGEVARFNWNDFNLKVKFKESTIFTFKIYQGEVKFGVSGGVKPLSAGFATGISIPADQDSLNNLSNFLKTLKNSKEIVGLNFGINYEGPVGKDGNDNAHVFFDAKIPSKNLLLADKAQNIESTVKTADVVTEKSSEKESKRTDFIGKVQNSIINFVSFHATTLFFHVTYPNGEYCKAESLENFDLKINLDVILPTIDLNVCFNDEWSKNLECFASAGIPRPVKISTKIIDGQICKVESAVLPHENTLDSSSALQSLNAFKYENNEIPVHASVKNLPKLIEFVDLITAKTKTVLTIGYDKDATNLNRVIGYIASSLLEIELPSAEPSGAKSKETSKKGTKQLTVCQDQDSVVSLNVRAESENLNEFAFMVNFKLPQNALTHIETVQNANNKFEWPAVRWGTFDYSFGIERLFQCSLTLNRGQIDIHQDGIVMSALNNFSLRLKLKTDDSFKLGSSNLRVILGSLKEYFATPEKDRHLIDSALAKDIQNRQFVYKFKMEHLRDINDGVKVFSNGSVEVKSLFDVIEAILKRPKHPKADDKEVNDKNVQDGVVEATEKVTENPFKDMKITIKTDPQIQKSDVSIPCLVPALCSEDSLLNAEKQIVHEGAPIELTFALENIFTPATTLIGKNLGSILKDFKMKNYPSDLDLNVELASDVWVTLVLDGAGLASVGLGKETTNFSRRVKIDYGTDAADFLLEKNSKPEDVVNLPLKFRFPSTIIGLRKTIAIFRKEAMLVPPVPPVFFDSESNAVKLTNPPLMISLSSDNPDDPKTNNLLSAVIAAVVPEMNVGSIEPDALLNVLHGEYKKPGAPKTAEETSKDVSVKKIDEKDNSGDQTAEIGNYAYTDLASLAFCLIPTTGIACKQVDVNFNMKLKFAVNLLKLILPSSSVFRLYFGDSAIFQFVADARKQKLLEVSEEKSLNILGTANVHLQGLPEFSSEQSNKLIDLFRGNEKKLNLRLQVIIGHDINLNANLNFPTAIISSYIYSKVGSNLKNYALGAINKLNPFSYFTSDVKVEEKPDKYSEYRPQMRECVDDTLIIDKGDRLKRLDFSKSAIYFEKGKEIFKAGKETKLYLQLRTDYEEVVCGEPDLAKSLRVKFFRYEDQGFIQLGNFLSFKEPEAEITEESKSVTFDSKNNLFAMNVKLPYPGRYKIVILQANQEIELKNSFVYVNNDY